MIINAYLVVGANGSLKVTKSKPSLERNEIAISLRLDIPNQVFVKPAIHAEIKISDDMVVPLDITPEVINNVENAFLENTGFELRIVQIPKEDEL